MKKKISTIIGLTFFIATVAIISFNSCNSSSSNVNQSEIDSLRHQINQLTANDATLTKNLVGQPSCSGLPANITRTSITLVWVSPVLSRSVVAAKKW